MIRSPAEADTARRRIRFSADRWILAPVTTWRAQRVARDFGLGMDARTAWVIARMTSHPEELHLALHSLVPAKISKQSNRESGQRADPSDEAITA